METTHATDELLSAGEVARLLGVGHSRVAALDAVLTPLRVGERRLRLYRRAVVEAYARTRAAARARALTTRAQAASK
jgi:hypothetical protein